MSPKAPPADALVPLYFAGAMTVEALRELLAPAGLVVMVDKAGRMVASPAPAFLRHDPPAVPPPRVQPFPEPDRAPVLPMRRPLLWKGAPW